MKKISLIVFTLVMTLSGIAQSKFGDDSDGVAKAKGSKEYDFNVVYVNGSTRQLTSTIDINYCMRTMFLEDAENEEAIYPAETNYIETTLKDGTVMQGMPRDSFWVFRIHEGNLNTYSTLPNNKFDEIEFLEKDGQWVEASEETFRESLSDNPEALAMFEKSLRKGKMSTAMGWAAGASVVMGLLVGDFGIDFKKYEDVNNDGERDNSPFIISYFHFGAVGMIGASIWFKHASKKRMKEAIEIYNQ